MEMSWAVNEFGQADLGDARRTKRLIWLAEQRAQQPSASIPQSCGGWTGSMAAYRFFSNPHISAESILGSHVQASLVRLQAERVVLAVQDTTELDFTSHPATLDLGYLADEQHQGLLVHSTLLVTPQRVGMGVLQQQVWTRSPEEFGQRGTRKDRAVAEKESQKWMASLEAAAQLQSQLPDTRVVSVGDREADVYDLFVRAQAPHQDLLVRAAQNRRVSEEQGYLWPQVESQPVAGQAVVSVQRQAERPARQATVEVRFCLVTLQPPRYRAGEGLPEVPVWAVGVREVDPPPDEEPIDWLLLTNVAVTNLAEAGERMAWYSCRWVVEMFHKVLKSGCRVEERQFGEVETLRRYLILDSIVAWRVLDLTLLGRQTPQLPCTVLLENDEWQALYCYHHHTTQLPDQIPSLQEAVRWIAQLGGFLGRKADKQPGTMTVWRGLQRLNDIAATWLLFHPSPDISV